MIAEDQSDPSEEATTATRVSRYLKQQEASSKNIASTGVSRYLAKQIILDSQKPKLSKVAKYLQEQSLKVSKKPSLTGVSKYLSKQPTSIKAKVVKEVKTPSKVLPVHCFARRKREE